MKLLHIMFPWLAKNQANKIDLDSVSKRLNGSADPLDVVSRGKDQGWSIDDSGYSIKLKKANEFPKAVINIDADDGLLYVGDSRKVIEGTVMDSAGSCAVADVGLTGLQDSAYTVPNAIAGWYVNQSFIGYQMCALLAQHWLVDKACSQSVEDSVRNGWTYKPDAGFKLTDEQKADIDDFDVSIKLKEVMMEAGRFTNIFGIRVLIFQMDKAKIPEDYYGKPFNPDGIPEGAYQGISQIDPYWMTPMMTDGSMQNPAAIGFYEPDYWIINGRRYHKSHLIILRGPQPADILKPTYIFGGIPLVQRIYERVYAAERTANEAPLLAMNKRTTAIHTDLDKMAANEKKFVERLLLWIKYRDNHAVKVLGKEEVMEQFDTSLSDFDSVIMNQYQLVAAIAKTPATKILGTSPKGFNATGEFETVSYHEELESIQERWMTPIIDRHYLCLCRSKRFEFGLNVNWEPVDAMTAAQQAEINSKKVNDAVALATAGMISPDEGREKLINDKDSGWNNLDKNDDADKDMGETPENIAELMKAGAEQEKAGAEETTAVSDQEQDADPYRPNKTFVDKANAAPTIDLILSKLQKIELAMMDDGFDKIPHPARSVIGIHGSTVGMDATTQGIGSIVPALPENKMPKVKVGGMICCIENPRNSIRSGVSLDGAWQVKMPHHYGYIKGTKGADGEEIDCFIGPNPKSGQAFIINQNDPNSGEFDEHKIMLGFDSAEDAKKGYEDSFSDGWKGFESIHPLAIDALRQWTAETREEAYGSRE